MNKELIEQISIKQAELRALKAQLSQEGCKEFESMVGKYYQLAATCSIKVKHIQYVAENEVSVECIKITGGKYDCGRIRINLTDDYSFQINEIYQLREISKDDFTKFMEECFVESGVKVLEAIDNQ